MHQRSTRSTHRVALYERNQPHTAHRPPETHAATQFFFSACVQPYLLYNIGTCYSYRTRWLSPMATHSRSQQSQTVSLHHTQCFLASVYQNLNITSTHTYHPRGSLLQSEQRPPRHYFDASGTAIQQCFFNQTTAASCLGAFHFRLTYVILLTAAHPCTCP